MKGHRNLGSRGGVVQPCEGGEAGRLGVGEGGVGALEGAMGDLPEMGGAQEGLLELGEGSKR